MGWILNGVNLNGVGFTVLSSLPVTPVMILYSTAGDKIKTLKGSIPSHYACCRFTHFN